LILRARHLNDIGDTVMKKKDAKKAAPKAKPAKTKKK
jgi:hypothetical protein